MAKKFLCIVLSLMLVFSCFAIGGFAADPASTPVYPEEELAITDAKDRIDRVFLTGSMSFAIPDKAASKDVLEHNLYFWDDEIIDEYHALEADASTTNEQWDALYRKMKTPVGGDWTVGELFEYRDESKAEFNVRLDASKKTGLEPGEEFDVDVYITSNFYTTALYATFFYNNDVVDIVGCPEQYIGTDLEFAARPEDDLELHELSDTFSRYTYLEMAHYGDYTYSGYYQNDPTLRVDRRELEWPKSIQQESGWKDKYEAYCFILTPIGKKTTTPINGIDGEEKLMTIKFKVKDDAAPGSTATIFAPSDSVWKLEGAGDRIRNNCSPCWQFFRVDPGSDARMVAMTDENAEHDHTLTCTPATITVAGEAVTYANYEALDAAIDDFDSSVAGLYTNASWTAYASAVAAGSALSRTLLASQQSTVDEATNAITRAKAKLVLNKIVSANVIGSPVIGSEANIKVVVNGSPKAIRLSEGENSLTFDRDSATITTDGDNEIWNVKVSVSTASTTYTVYAKYGNEYGENGTTVVVNATEGLDLSIHSLEVPDMYPSGSYTDGKIYQGVHNVVVKTSSDVFKVQFIDADGNTRTYDKENYAPVVEGDELVWTLPLSFTYLGNVSFDLRTRAVDTTFAYTGDTISARVVY